MLDAGRANALLFWTIGGSLLSPSLLACPSFAQTATSPSTMPTAPRQAQTLDDAKDNFRRASQSLNGQLSAARDRLKAAYDAAIKRAAANGDFDGAIALRNQRDSFLDAGTLPFVEGGWTIMFRSADPFLFNVPVQNGNSYSMPMNLVPEGTHYLRFGRMDTKEYVIIKITANETLSNGPLSANYWWRGDKCIDHHACELGITDQRSPSNCNVIMAIEPGGNYAGYGFGRTVAGDRLGCVWANVEIAPTVFEIAVTEHNLTPEETDHLLQ